jgi:hypothetical protein
MWDRETGAMVYRTATVRSVQVHSSDLTCIAWNSAADDVMLATGNHNGGVHIWSTSPTQLSHGINTNNPNGEHPGQILSTTTAKSLGNGNSQPSTSRSMMAGHTAVLSGSSLPPIAEESSLDLTAVAAPAQGQQPLAPPLVQMFVENDFQMASPVTKEFDNAHGGQEDIFTGEVTYPSSRAQRVAFSTPTVRHTR